MFNNLYLPKFLLFFSILFILHNLTSVAHSQTEKIGKWKRFEITYDNNSFDGNPFDLEFYGVFRHADSGRTLKQLGFYAGENQWKIYFMPDDLGEWRFTTHSTDPDLDGQIGSFSCSESGLPGKLTPAGNRWKLVDLGKTVFPIMIPSRKYLKSTRTKAGISDFIDWADEVVGARIIGTTLVYFHHEQDEKPYVEGEEGILFNIPMWDRLNSHYDYLRDKGMGHYIMMYSDDSEAPTKNGVAPQSQAELRLFRYIVARFSCYPIVLWDTGIDIGETRSDSWIEWFTDWFTDNDPWQHPVSSRTGGGSGGIYPNHASYYSDGTSTLPSFSDFVSVWEKRTVPTAMTDRWREDYGRGGFDRDKIRKAVWQMGLTGATAVYVSGNDSGGYLSSGYASDFKAASDCGRASAFFGNEVLSLNNLDPHQEFVVSADADDAFLSANPGIEYVVYLSNGRNITLDLSHAASNLSCTWFNPKTGERKEAPAVSSGGIVNLSSPGSGDWILHLLKKTITAPGSPKPPIGLKILSGN